MFPVYVLSPTFTVTGAPATGLPSSSVTLPVTFVGLPASAFLIGSTVKFASCLPTFAVVVLFAGLVLSVSPTLTSTGVFPDFSGVTGILNLPSSSVVPV